MTRYALRLLEDQLQVGIEAAASLPAVNRVVYVVEGEVTITARDEVTEVSANAAWYGAGSCTITRGSHGARLWRWELVSLPVQSNGLLVGETAVSTEKLMHEVTLDPQHHYLIRCDRVDFPPGGIAYTHTHQGPGIRCLLFGEFTVQVHDRRTLFQPGGAWFESGPEPVYAMASDTGPAAFVRVMILPRALKGKSSIRYVKPEDQDKPKPQWYTMFLDEDIVI
jgi:quercetin dioxygenase-like cupin family protein